MSVIILIVILLAACLIGLFLLLKPEAGIELQRRFYERINWRIEPISMTKEINNTRIMGIAILVFCAAGLIYLLVNTA